MAAYSLNPGPRAQPRPNAPWAVGMASILILACLVLPVLSGGYFGDDFEFVFENPSSAVLGAFVRLHPYGLYRPIEFSTTALSKVVFGETTLPPHFLNLIVHAGLVLLCLRVLRELNAPPFAAPLTFGWLVFSQSNAGALGGNDSLSLILGTLTGTSAAWLLYPRGPVSFRNRVVSLSLYVVALFSKESSLGYLPVLIGLSCFGAEGKLDRPGSIIRRSAAYPAVTILYMALRQSLGGELPNATPRAFAAGLNVVINSVMIFFGAVTPVSTLEFFTGAVRHQPLWPAAGLLGAGAVLLIMVSGMRAEKRLTWALALVAAGECAIVPMIFQRRVSELYGYALLPLVSVIFGWSAAALIARASTAWRRYALIGVVMVLLLSQALSLRQKAEGMARNGDRAAVQMANMLSLARTLPNRSVLILVEPDHDLPEYSVYRMSGFRLTPAEEIERLSGRNDIIVRYADETTHHDDRPRVRVTLDGREPRILQQ